MASNKSGLKRVSSNAGGGLGGALIKILAVGVAGGALLISGARTLGEALLDKQESDSKKLADRRESDKEAVRRIMANDPEEQ